MSIFNRNKKEQIPEEPVEQVDVEKILEDSVEELSAADSVEEKIAALEAETNTEDTPDLSDVLENAVVEEIAEDTSEDAAEEVTEEVTEDVAEESSEATEENVEEIPEETAEETPEEILEEEEEIPVKEVSFQDEGDDDDGLVFISHESVRDRSKMASGTIIEDEMLTEKKTTRRGVDEKEAKRERSRRKARKNIVLIIILIVVIIGALIYGGKKLMEIRAEKAAANKEQPVSTQEYEQDGYAEINTLIQKYYDLYASGDTENIIQYAYPMSDSEKDYIGMYKQYVESYNNIVCYTKTGADDKSFIVSVAYDVKYKDCGTPAPGLGFFYVREASDGSYYIDNTYSPFNLVYQEYNMDSEIIQLINDYQQGDDVAALTAGVQTQYENALTDDENLKNIVEVTVANAVAEWNASHEAAIQAKKDEATAQVKEEIEAEEKKKAEEEKKKKEAEEAAKEVEDRAWVYANDSVNIRKEPSETSEILASVIKGDELRQIATRKDGWTKIQTGDIIGYVKSEFISKEKPSSGNGGGGSLTEGSTVTLSSSVNMRSSMSENSDRVALVYAGEKVTVVMSYAEGWTKVNYNGKTGYIKTSVLN